MTFFFFRLQSSHWSVHYLETFLKPPNTKSGQGKLSQKCTPFIFYFFEETYKTGRAQRVPPLNFFGIVPLCFENFSMSPKVPSFEFLIFCNILYVNKYKIVPRFTFFDTMRHFSKEKNVLRFLSLRYSADFRRSRFISTPFDINITYFYCLLCCCIWKREVYW